MNLHDLLLNNPDVNITVSGKDLLEFGQSIAKQSTEVVLQAQDEKTFSAKDIESKFGICAATRWRWDKLGILKGSKVGNRIYYRESDVKALLEKKGMK